MGVETMVEGAARPAPRVTGGASVIALAALASLQLWLIFNHSPWLDEVQALLIAQQSWPTILGLLHYEGHPVLWYAVLKLGTTFSNSPLVLPAIQAGVSLAILGVIWRFSPFSWRTKLLICAGYFIVFEYGVIARSYGLGVLLFFGFVALRRSFWAWVLLALLANVALHTAFLAGVGALWLLYERRWSWAGAALLAIAGLFCLATIWPAGDVVRAVPIAGPGTDRLLLALMTNASAIVAFNPSHIGWGLQPPIPLSYALGLAPLVLGAWALRTRPVHVALFLGFYAALFLLAATVYTAYPRHLGFAAVLFIGLLWAQAEEGLAPSFAAKAWLGFMALSGVYFAVLSLFIPFTSAREIAQWVRAEGLEAKPWAAFHGFTGLDITGQLGMPTFNLQKACWNTYQRWDYNQQAHSSREEVRDRIDRFAAAVGEGYVLTDAPVQGLTPLRSFRGGILGYERYVSRVSAPFVVAKPLSRCY